MSRNRHYPRVGRGAGVVTLVVTGVVAARWRWLPRPVSVAVGGPVAVVALAPVLGLPLRLVAPDVEWEGLVAWAASGRDARMTGTMLTVVALVVVSPCSSPPIVR